MSRQASDEIIAGQAALSVNDPGTPVPEGWKRVRLIDIAQLESGHTPSRSHPEWWGGNVPWLSLPDAREHHGRVIHETTQKTNELGLANSAARWLPKDTVCLSRTASVGYVTRLGCPMATSQDFVNWICSDALEPRFLMYALLAEGDHIREFGKGTTHTTIYFPEVLAFHLDLAPLAEQRRIVEKVEALLEQVNRMKGRLERVSAILKRFRQSVLAAACSGELTAEWRSAKSFERNREESESPSSWRCRTVAQVATLVTDGDHNPPKRVAVGVPHLTAKHVKGGRLLTDGCTFISPDDYVRVCKRYEPKAGDIIVTCVGTLGQTAIVPEGFTFSPDRNLAAIRIQPEIIIAEFLMIVLQSPPLQKEMAGSSGATAQPHLYLGDLRRLEIAVPPLPEQTEIVRQVNRLFALADTIERRVNIAKARVEKLPQAILSKAFSGELVPTEAELARLEGRTYETAEALLARVRNEPAKTNTATKPARKRGGAKKTAAD